MLFDTQSESAAR